MQEQRSASWQHEEIYAPLLRLQLGILALRNNAEQSVQTPSIPGLPSGYLLEHAQ